MLLSPFFASLCFLGRGRERHHRQFLFGASEGLSSISALHAFKDSILFLPRPCQPKDSVTLCFFAPFFLFCCLPCLLFCLYWVGCPSPSRRSLFSRELPPLSVNCLCSSVCHLKLRNDSPSLFSGTTDPSRTEKVWAGKREREKKERNQGLARVRDDEAKKNKGQGGRAKQNERKEGQ